MDKILFILLREYLTRVKKKSFIIMSFVGPILMAALFIVPVWLATMEDDEKFSVAVLDESQQFYKSLTNTEIYTFTFLPEGKISELKKTYFESGYNAVLNIPKDIENPNQKLTLYSDQQIKLSVQSYITQSIEKEIERLRMNEKGIDVKMLDSIEADLNINTIVWTAEGDENESSTELSMAIGFVFALIIYMFIFMYGAQVMRGVMEEKTGRIVEIIISSVKPFQLMMGKILGIALVALTQFLLWIVLTLAIVMTANVLIVSNSQNTPSSEVFQNTTPANPDVEKMLENSNSNAANFMKIVYNLPFGMILFSFIFFFIGGYLLYASLFAAIGGAVDNETDVQQFMLPITIPLILSIVLAQTIIQNPHGSVAFWFSIFPFTSPVIMIIRVGFGVPWWEMALSMFLLIITFIGTTWVAAKIYRTGILLYGKKVTYKELWKWLRY
jgi:ABC-2 type transport system permease protein